VGGGFVRVWDGVEDEEEDKLECGEVESRLGDDL